jgi:ABC-type sugar transport system substrate-binding protein
VLFGALAMFAIEFVVDKVPYLDNAWDAVQTVVRPAIGSALGVAFAGDAGVGGLEEALAGGGSGAMALASHAVKAGLRLGVNSSPEPFSNIAVSLAEDFVAAGVIALAVNHPVPAAAIALALLAAGIALVMLLAGRIRRALPALGHRRGRPPPPP